MQRAGEVPEGHPFADDRAEAPGMRQRADQHVGRSLPRRGRQLKPVELDLLPGGMVDLDRRRAPAALLTDQTQRPKLKAAQLTHKRRIGAIEARRDELLKQRHRRQMRILDEPRGDVALEAFKTARARSRSRPPSPARYLRTVLRSRPVCRAIADTDQPRACNA